MYSHRQPQRHHHALAAQAQGASCQLQGAGNEKSGRRQVSLNNWGQDLISQKI